MKDKKNFRRLPAAILVIALTLLMLTPAALAASYKAKISSSSARIYRSPNTSSSSVKAPKGVTVTVTGTSGSWAKITYKGRKGYMKKSDLEVQKTRKTAYVAHETKLYKSASDSSDTLATLGIGTTVYVIGSSGSYAHVQNRSGSVTGYVKAGDLSSKKVSPPKAPSFSATTKAQKAAKLAVSYVGRPYGSNEPSSFNCSSLVRYCFGKYGYSMKGSAAAIAADNSLKRVSSYSDAKIGDILCFDTNGSGECDHVAIYLGKGYFVEASQSAKKVQINTMSSWYKSHLVCIRRV